MIIFVDNSQLDFYPGLKSAIFKLRWHGLRKLVDASDEEVETLDLVMDVLDDIAPSYLVCLEEETGAVLATLRILQTMGPHTLSELVPEVIEDDHPPRSPCLWELSRICISGHIETLAPEYSYARIAGEMMVGAIEVAMRAGVSDYILILNKDGDEFVTKAGIDTSEKLGRSIVCKWGTDVAAVPLNCSQEIVAEVRKATGVSHDVWEGDCPSFSIEQVDRDAAVNDMAFIFREALKGKLPVGVRRKLQLYCAQQLLDAKTESEKRDALRLMKALGRLIENPEDEE